MNNYIYWIGHDKGESGSYPTREAAENAIQEGIKTGWLDPNTEWRVIPHEITTCPTCGQPAEKDIVEGLGECLRCDHVRGDVMYDNIEEDGE